MSIEWEEALRAAILTPHPFNLACVGVSISGLNALTIESISCIIHADIVYTYAVSPAHLAHLRMFNDMLIDLNAAIYTPGQERARTYADITQLIMKDIRSGRRVCYAQQGSPTFLSFTGTILRRAAISEGFDVIVLPGVSSFECLLTELAQEHDLYDIQILNCGSIMQNSRLLNNGVSCILFNLVTYASEHVTRHAETFSRTKVEALAVQLAACYGPSHVVYTLSILPSGRVKKDNARLAELPIVLRQQPSSVSLFIPPAKQDSLGRSTDGRI